MKIRHSKLKKLVKQAKNQIKPKIPRYSHKFSPKKYEQYQLAVICLLKIRLKADYRDVVDFISEMPKILEILELENVPHFTTLQKFLDRISETMIYRLIVNGIQNLNIVAIDSTGFSSSYSSRYYEGKFLDVKSRNFEKFAMIIDVKTKKIANLGVYQGYSHDTKHFVPLMRKIKAKVVLADKGYDAGFIIQYVLDDKAIPVIAIKHKQEVKSLLRKKAFYYWISNEEVYHKRVLIESSFFVIKKKFGDFVSSRKPEIKRKELFMKGLLYNLYVDVRNMPDFLDLFYKPKVLILGL